MISVLNLDREQRIKEVVNNILLKDSLSSTHSPFSNLLSESEVNVIIQSIEDRIYYISESPSFEFNGKNHTTFTYNCNSIENFKSLMDNNSNDFFVIYTLQNSPSMLSSVQSISKTSSYLLRGCFINDPSIFRNKIINEILGEE